MSEFQTYNFIVNGNEVENDQYLRNIIDQMEMQLDEEKQTIAYARHEFDYNGISVYYDYGADYYFFTPQPYCFLVGGELYD